MTHWERKSPEVALLTEWLMSHTYDKTACSRERSRAFCLEPYSSNTAAVNVKFRDKIFPFLQKMIFLWAPCVHSALSKRVKREQLTSAASSTQKGVDWNMHCIFFIFLHLLPQVEIKAVWNQIVVLSKLWEECQGFIQMDVFVQKENLQKNWEILE